MDLKDWLECADYRITEGDNFGWNCWGSNAYSLSSWNGEQDGYSLNIVFDTKTQVVYCVEACDYKNNRAYRYLNRDHSSSYHSEVSNRSIEDNAWDGVKWIDLEVYEDWREKATAIVMGIDYDTRVSIPLDLPEDQLLTLFKAAHERNMTFNDFVEKALSETIKEWERDPEGMKSTFNSWKNSEEKTSTY